MWLAIVTISNSRLLNISFCYLNLLILYSTNPVLQSDMTSKLPHLPNLRVPMGTLSRNFYSFGEFYFKFYWTWISKGPRGAHGSTTNGSFRLLSQAIDNRSIRALCMRSIPTIPGSQRERQMICRAVGMFTWSIQIRSKISCQSRVVFVNHVG